MQDHFNNCIHLTTKNSRLNIISLLVQKEQKIKIHTAKIE